MMQCGLDGMDRACGIEEIKRIEEQALLPQARVKVISKDFCHAIVYEGPDAEVTLHLYHHHEHFDVITGIATFYNQSFWCEKCNKAYDHKEDHRCNNKCKYCYSTPACPVIGWNHCADCGRNFPNRVCFDKHKQKRKVKVGEVEKEVTSCEQHKVCKTCGALYSPRNLSGKAHVCYSSFCRCCRDYVKLDDHLCFMQPIKPKKQKKKDKKKGKRTAAEA